MRRALVALCIAGGLNAVSVAAAQNPAQPALPPATMAGVVRDSTGAPIADAEVVVREMTQGTRTNARGEFTLRDVSPGAYQVWFRRLGYRSIDYNWDARPGERTEVTVVLHAIPRTLDPVVVRAEEDRRLKGSSSILGIVVDSAGTPIEEAEVQLVGANRLGVTRPNGGFLFRPLPVGQYLIRVRKLGYVPTNMTLNLVDHDDREVIIKMRGLPVKLDAMVTAERSGYAPDDHALGPRQASPLAEFLQDRRRWSRSTREIRDDGHGPGDGRAWRRRGDSGRRAHGASKDPASLRSARTDGKDSLSRCLHFAQRQDAAASTARHVQRRASRDARGLPAPNRDNGNGRGQDAQS